MAAGVPNTRSYQLFFPTAYHFVFGERSRNRTCSSVTDEQVPHKNPLSSLVSLAFCFCSKVSRSARSPALCLIMSLLVAQTAETADISTAKDEKQITTTPFFSEAKKVPLKPSATKAPSSGKAAFRVCTDLYFETKNSTGDRL